MAYLFGMSENEYMNNKELVKIETIQVPTRYGIFLLTTYITDIQSQPYMKYIIVLQTKKLNDTPIIRIHSSCLFSETFNSQLCDCHDQLKKSLKLISKKQGIIFYLDQEGRSHGLFNKILEFKLQEQGSDTVEASQKLNLPVDNRNYGIIGKILKMMNINKIRLITNNPQKIKDLEKESIKVVERIILKTSVNKYNKRYLRTKKEKLHHMLDI